MNCSNEISPDLYCGELINYIPLKGRKHHFLQYYLDIPEETIILSCSSCKEYYLTCEEGEVLEKIMEPIILDWQVKYISDLINNIQKTLDFEVSFREFAFACGVQGGYFNEVLNKEIKMQLAPTKLLELYSENPELIRRECFKYTLERWY